MIVQYYTKNTNVPPLSPLFFLPRRPFWPKLPVVLLRLTVCLAPAGRCLFPAGLRGRRAGQVQIVAPKGALCQIKMLNLQLPTVNTGFEHLLTNPLTMIKRLFMAALALVAALPAAAQQGAVYNLWPQGPSTPGPDPADTARVTVFLPPAGKATGRAVVICPGGGYQVLAMGHEGTDWAPFFNRQGIAAIVLKYRMPHGVRNIPVEDAEEAMRLTRRMAASWNIDPQQVGIMGFSAGGHLASTVATQGKGDAAPNFQILFYPVITMDPAYTHRGTMNSLLGAKPAKRDIRANSSDQQVTRVTPRAFIALSDDDHTVLPANGVNYYLECYRHDVPATLHVYPDGGHGWGILPSFAYHVEMLLDLKAWLSSF